MPQNEETNDQIQQAYLKFILNTQDQYQSQYLSGYITGQNEEGLTEKDLEKLYQANVNDQNTAWLEGYYHAIEDVSDVFDIYNAPSVHFAQQKNNKYPKQ